MDLTSSPDLDAGLCYAVVAALGVVAAIRQLSNRLGDLFAWQYVETWLLFACYVAVPLALFWFLDRTKVISDTSLFAAVLIGVGYERILTGAPGTLAVPSQVSQVWQPLVAWTDRVTNRIVQDRDAIQRKRLNRWIAAISTTEKLDKLKQLVIEQFPDPAKIETALNQVTIPGIPPDGEPNLRRQARKLFEFLAAVPDAVSLPEERSILGEGVAASKFTRVLAPLKLAILSLAAVALVSAGIWSAYRYQWLNYLVWRLEKPNATATDLARTRRNIAAALDSQSTRGAMAEALISAVESPSLPATRLDDVVALLLEHRQQIPRLRNDLIALLRTSNPDVRARAQNALLFLHKEESGAKLPAELENWKPSAADTTAAIEDHVTMWKEA